MLFVLSDFYIKEGPQTNPQQTPGDGYVPNTFKAQPHSSQWPWGLARCTLQSHPVPNYFPNLIVLPIVHSANSCSGLTLSLICQTYAKTRAQALTVCPT